MRYLSRIYDSMLAPAGTFDPASAIHDTARDRRVTVHSSATNILATGSSMTRFSQRGEPGCRKITSIVLASAAVARLDKRYDVNPPESIANKNKEVL